MPETISTPDADPELLTFAIDLAHKAGLLSAQLFFTPSAQARTTKDDGTEVTEADLRVEDLMRAELARYRPDDDVYGEERGGVHGRQPHWVLDPIDGTYCFTRRIPTFTNVITYIDEFGPALAVINDPIARTTLHAARGHGCWLQLRSRDDDVARDTAGTSRRVRVSARAALDGARTLMHDPSYWPEELLLTLHRRVRLQVVGGLADLATGHLDALVAAGTPMGYEDLVPLTIIFDEAGGQVSDLQGEPILTGDGSILITNGALHQDFIDLLRTSRC